MGRNGSQNHQNWAHLDKTGATQALSPTLDQTNWCPMDTHPEGETGSWWNSSAAPATVIKLGESITATASLVGRRFTWNL